MDHLDYHDHDFDLECEDNEKVVEITIVRRNLESMRSINTARTWLLKLQRCTNIRRKSALLDLKDEVNLVLVRKASMRIENLVYHAGDKRQVMKYLLCFGYNRLLLGKSKEAMQFYEAAFAIVDGTVGVQLPYNMYRHLSMVYKNLGKYRKIQKLFQLFFSRSIYFIEETEMFCLNVKPFSSWQGEEEFSVIGWEQNLFGTNNSRKVSCGVKDGLLVAKRSFNVGEVIFIDKPIVGYVANSKGQCNYCTWKTMFTVPCTICYAVFYCGVDCLRKDAHDHKYECRGFKILFFPLLNGVLELRMLVKALDILKHDLLRRPVATIGPTNCQQLWNVLLATRCKHAKDFLTVFCRTKCGFLPSDTFQYKILLQKVSILLEYIAFERQLLEDYKQCWNNVSEIERDIFLGSVLLRISMLVKTQSCTFSYDLAYDRKDIDERIRSRWPDSEIISAVLSATDVSKQDTSKSSLSKDMLQLCSTSDSGGITQNRNNVALFWKSCLKNAEQDRLEQSRAKKSIIANALEYYSQNFYTKFSFLEQAIKNVSVHNQYLGMYRFTSEMEHCCSSSNAIGILLNHGAVAFRATKKISKGEKIRFRLTAIERADLEAMNDDERSVKGRAKKSSFQKPRLYYNHSKDRLAKWDYVKDVQDPRLLSLTIETLLYCIHSELEPFTEIKYREILFLLQRSVRLLYKWPKDEGFISLLLQLITKIENVYYEARMISEVLMQHDWMIELIDYGKELRRLKLTSNRNLANYQFQKIF